LGGRWIMERHRGKPRNEWQKIVEGQGLTYHTVDGQPYWDESAYYTFSSREIDAIETATYELDKMCLAGVQHILDQKLFSRFQIPEQFSEYVTRSWDTDEVTIYGRFDLAY